MKYTIICSMIITFSAFFALIFGLVNMRKKDKGFFYSFVVFGFFGFAIGYLYMLLLEITGADGMVFSLGSIGVVSGFLSISFSCSTIKKVDSCEVQNIKKYKQKSVCVPIFFAICWGIMLFSKIGFEKMIIPTLLMFSAMPCAYFCFLNIITPYPKKSFVKCFKPFFVLVFISNLTTMLTEMIWILTNKTLINCAWHLSLTVSTVCYILMPVFLEEGNKKWNRM